MRKREIKNSNSNMNLNLRNHKHFHIHNTAHPSHTLNMFTHTHTKHNLLVPGRGTCSNNTLQKNPSPQCLPRRLTGITSVQMDIGWRLAPLALATNAAPSKFRIKKTIPKPKKPNTQKPIATTVLPHTLSRGFILKFSQFFPRDIKKSVARNQISR